MTHSNIPIGFGPVIVALTKISICLKKEVDSLNVVEFCESKIVQIAYSPTYVFLYESFTWIFDLHFIVHLSLALTKMCSVQMCLHGSADTDEV